MTTIERLPGSYRDPDSHVLSDGNRIFRTISDRAAADFRRVAETGLLEALVADGTLVPWRDVDVALMGAQFPDAAIVIEPERLDFISHPYEWSFRGLKVAALAHLDIQLRALACDVSLSDASAYNVQFRGTRPVFIDHGSFRLYRDGEFWRGHRQFCEQFLNPLLLRSLFGIPHNDWYRGRMDGLPAETIAALLPWRSRMNPRLLTHVILPARFARDRKVADNAIVARAVHKGRLPRRSFEGMLEGLRKWIAGLEPRTRGNSVWSGYTSEHSYDESAVARKRAFVARFADRVKPRIVWDIGCNTGEYSKIALEAGAGLAIGFETDADTLDMAFDRAVKEGLDFLPLYLDAVNPSPSQGWNQTERDGFQERRNADAVLALAILHHICIARNVPLADALDWLIGLAPRGVIEFVPKNDIMVRELLRLREDIFDGYTDQAFDSEVMARARVVTSETITDSGRRLIWYDRT